jgi:hypothetical protein
VKRQIPGLHAEQPKRDDPLEGAFLVRVDRVFYRWHPQRPFYVLRFAILEPNEHQGRFFTGRLYCSPKALWKLRLFLRDFGYVSPALERTTSPPEHALVRSRGPTEYLIKVLSQIE